MAFFILSLLSARDLDISRGLTRAIWKRPCINLFITYFVRADNMLLPFTRGQITCYCPHKMLLPRRQITRRKLCFYYTCKFRVISIKYVIIYKNVCLSDIIAVNKSWREYLLCVIVVLSSWCFTLYTYIVYISTMNISWSYNIHYTLPFNFVFVIIMYSQ